RSIPQWFVKISAYADELLDSLDDMPDWPDAVRTMQRNWIGRSEGLEIDFAVAASDTALTVFTTRPDTLFGVTYMALAADHPLVVAAAEQDVELARFCEECRRAGTAEADLETRAKRGYRLDFTATHPLTGDVVPVYVAN